MSEHTWQVDVSGDCIGAGLCVTLAPHHFEFFRGRAQSTENSMPEADAIDLIRIAAEGCPARAISISAG